MTRHVSAAQLGTAYGLMTALQQAGVFAANVLAGYINDRSGASAANPAGYDAMLWYFGILSVAAALCAALLWARDVRVARPRADVA